MSAKIVHSVLAERANFPCLAAKSANLSLEGELSSLNGEIFAKTGEEKSSRIDKSEVVAMKRRALAL